MRTTTELKQALTGISGILVSPFDADDKLDPVRLAPIVHRAVGAGVHILVANGNTGEFPALTVLEAEKMVHAAAEHIDGRAPLIGGVGRALADACQLARASQSAGADALMIHQPPDPFCAPRGLVDYVKAIADAVPDLPLVLYLRNATIGADIISALCDVETVIGVKWAVPNPLELQRAIGASDPSIVWVGGLAEVWAPTFYAVGARGFTSGLINIWPDRSMAIHGALEAGHYQAAVSLIREIAAFEDLRAEESNGTNVTVVKSALALIGEDCGRTRPPSAWPLTQKQMAVLTDFMSAQNG